MRDAKDNAVIAFASRTLQGALICLVLIALPAESMGFTQVIENPAAALAPDAGRVLKISEVLRITDEGGEFFFKSPSDLRIADDGSIFVADQTAGQFLKFSSDGRFLKNLYKKGQGPGEFEGGIFGFQYFPYETSLFILDFTTQRFWRTDLEGVFQEEINLARKSFSYFLGILPSGFLLVKESSPAMSERTGRLLEVPHEVLLVGRDGRGEKEICLFRPKSFYGNHGGMFWDPFIAAMSSDGKTLYVCCGRDYLVEAIDLAAGRIVRRFGRRYPKVPHQENEFEPEFRKKLNTPKIEFESDIKNVFCVSDRLWVETSTDDKTKGRLIDVFDENGRFVDSFHLGAGRTLMAVRDGILFTQEKNEDETIVIKKYRILQ